MQPSRQFPTTVSMNKQQKYPSCLARLPGTCITPEGLPCTHRGKFLREHSSESVSALLKTCPHSRSLHPKGFPSYASRHFLSRRFSLSPGHPTGLRVSSGSSREGSQSRDSELTLKIPVKHRATSLPGHARPLLE